MKGARGSSIREQAQLWLITVLTIIILEKKKIIIFYEGEDPRYKIIAEVTH